MTWISVNDRLPDQDQQVLCLSDRHEFYTAYYSRIETKYEPGYRDTWNHGFCCGGEPDDPVYWMPLTEPPKGIL